MVACSVSNDMPIFFIVDFSIQVLSSGSWPFQQTGSFNLPVEVSLSFFVFLSIFNYWSFNVFIMQSSLFAWTDSVQTLVFALSNGFGSNRTTATRNNYF